MNSPDKKKMRTDQSSDLEYPGSSSKRSCEDMEASRKRVKTEVTEMLEEDLQSKKRKNFITACEIVSYKAYFNQRSRFQLVYLPTCARKSSCKHQDFKNASIKQIASYAEESFKIEMKTNMWREALEVCKLCITPERYLSANILKDIVEIMLNAHTDEYADYTIEHLINKCQQIFELNFSYHPPCLVKTLRKCYNDFLTSPLELKENTFTNRSQFGYDKGIVKYCFNRLEYEISQDSIDGPLVDKYEHIPEEMKQSVKGLHWQKEKFEIYEMLERTERIKRLIAVLDSIVELLQFDLAIWNSRYTNNLGSHIMRSHKPLMAYLLWSKNVLFTGTVNNNCRQVLRLFIYLIQLEYPEEHIRVLTLWLNTMIQTFYICENNSNSDYPNTGKYCSVFAEEFYKLISGIPQEHVIKILERIKPEYMQYLIGTIHLRKLLASQEDSPISILVDFIRNSKWKQFSENKTEIKTFKKTEHSLKKYKNLIKYINKKCETFNANFQQSSSSDTRSLKKLEDCKISEKSKVSLNEVVHILYVVLSAYLDAFNVRDMQEALDKLNEQLLHGNSSSDTISLPLFCSYSVTEHFVKKYRTIFQTLRDVMIILQESNSAGELPISFKIFAKLGL